MESIPKSPPSKGASSFRSSGRMSVIRKPWMVISFSWCLMFSMVLLVVYPNVGRF